MGYLLKICSRILSEYFGDTEAKDCGICDICLARRKREKQGKELRTRILDKLTDTPLTVRDIVAEFQCDPQPLLDTLKQMHDEGLVCTNSAGEITKIVKED